MKTVRDRLYIEESKKGKYEYLKKEDIFKDKSNKDLFLLAMVIGFKNNLRKELKRKNGFVRTEYLNEDDIALIDALGLEETDNTEFLLDQEKIFEIAEEFANTGIDFLMDQICGSDFSSIERRFEKLVIEADNELND